MAGIFVLLQMAAQHGAARECRVAESTERPQVTEDGVADHGGFSGEIGLIQRAGQNGASGNDVAYDGMGGGRDKQKDERQSKGFAGHGDSSMTSLGAHPISS